MALEALTDCVVVTFLLVFVYLAIALIIIAPTMREDVRIAVNGLEAAQVGHKGVEGRGVVVATRIRLGENSQALVLAFSFRTAVLICLAAVACLTAVRAVVARLGIALLGLAVVLAIAVLATVSAFLAA